MSDNIFDSHIFWARAIFYCFIECYLSSKCNIFFPCIPKLLLRCKKLFYCNDKNIIILAIMCLSFLNLYYEEISHNIKSLFNFSIIKVPIIFWRCMDFEECLNQYNKALLLSNRELEFLFELTEIKCQKPALNTKCLHKEISHIYWHYIFSVWFINDADTTHLLTQLLFNIPKT